MSSTALGCDEPAAGEGGDTKDCDAKEAMGNGYADVLGVCNLSASSSESDGSSSSSSSSSSRSSSGSSRSSRSRSSSSSGSSSNSSSSSSDSSSDEDDRSVSGCTDVVGEAPRAVDTSVDRFQNAPPPWITEADESAKDANNHHGPQVSVVPAVRIPRVTLVNESEFLPWMELQVSPKGRYMHPAPTIRFSNLHDELQYVTWLSFVQASGVSAGDYMHPESPRPGTSWNEKPLSFSKLKLYAYRGTFCNTPITLMCNKKYFLRINIGNVDEYGHILKKTVIRQAIVGTWFVPVNCHRTRALMFRKTAGRGRGRGRPIKWGK